MTNIGTTKGPRRDATTSAGHGSNPAGTILVGVDGSLDSLEAARWACQLASVTKSDVELVQIYAHHDFTTPRFFPSERGVPAYTPEIGAALRREEIEALKESQTTLDCEQAAAAAVVSEVVQIARAEYPDVRLSSRVVQCDDVGLALVTEAEHAWMLVVGSRGVGAFRGLLGSVGAYVARHARCPVTVLPSQKRATAAPRR